MRLWIARDCTGLWAFSEKPNKKGDEFVADTIYCRIYQLDSEFLPEITIENSPQEAELKLIKNQEE